MVHDQPGPTLLSKAPLGKPLNRERFERLITPIFLNCFSLCARQTLPNEKLGFTSEVCHSWYFIDPAVRNVLGSLNIKYELYFASDV